MDKIVFICTGNTCRSPMAEGIFRALSGEERLHLTAASAGIFTQNGIAATDNAVAAAAERGAAIAGHVSQLLTPELAMEAKYLVGMTGAHFDELTRLYPKYENKIYTLSPKDIADPFGGSLVVYRATATQIYEAVQQLITMLEKRA